MSKHNKPKRAVCNLEFKQKEYTHQQAADSLGVSLSAIGRWVRAERGPTVGTNSTSSLSGQTELVRLMAAITGSCWEGFSCFCQGFIVFT